jgi:acyl-CoA thioester hydrolase
MPDSLEHLFTCRTYIEDTDMGGVVHHRNYLKYAERARVEFLNSLGFDLADFIKEGQVFFVIRKCVIEYLAPAFFGDLLQVKTTLLHWTKARIVFKQILVKDDKAIADIQMTLASVDGKMKKLVPIPEALRAILSKFETNN